MQIKYQLNENKLGFLVIAVFAVVISVYSQTFARIIDMWSIRDYQYGWLVYPISFYVLAKKRDALALTQWRTSVWGVLLVVSLVLVWIMARAVGIQVVEFASATLLIFAAFFALAGTDAIRTTAFPLLLLLAAVPMGGFLVEPLMKITAEIASSLLNVTGVPVLREGQFFVLPGGSFEVADVCSGLRYLLAGAMASLAYAYVTYSNNAKRMLFVGIGAIVIVFMNGVRAFIVMYVASATDMKVLGGQDHVMFGMVLFAMVFIVLIWAGEAYADRGSEHTQAHVGKRDNAGSAVSGILVILTLLTLIAGPVFSSAMINRGAQPIVDVPFPSLDSCGQSTDWTSDERPVFLNADYHKQRLFNCGDHETGIYVASYGKQQQGKELIGWGNRVWPDRWRRYADQSTVSVTLDGASFEVQQVLVRDPTGWKLIWYWYHVGSSITSSPMRVKVSETLRALTLQPSESSVVVVSVTSSNEGNAADLRKQLGKHADRIMKWNRRRVALGGRQ